MFEETERGDVRFVSHIDGGITADVPLAVYPVADGREQDPISVGSGFEDLDDAADQILSAAAEGSVTENISSGKATELVTIGAEEFRLLPVEATIEE